MTNVLRDGWPGQLGFGGFESGKPFDPAGFRRGERSAVCVDGVDHLLRRYRQPAADVDAVGRAQGGQGNRSTIGRSEVEKACRSSVHRDRQGFVRLAEHGAAGGFLALEMRFETADDQMGVTEPQLERAQRIAIGTEIQRPCQAVVGGKRRRPVEQAQSGRSSPRCPVCIAVANLRNAGRATLERGQQFVETAQPGLEALGVQGEGRVG